MVLQIIRHDPRRRRGIDGIAGTVDLLITGGTIHNRMQDLPVPILDYGGPDNGRRQHHRSPGCDQGSADRGDVSAEREQNYPGEE